MLFIDGKFRCNGQLLPVWLQREINWWIFEKGEFWGLRGTAVEYVWDRNEGVGICTWQNFEDLNVENDVLEFEIGGKLLDWVSTMCRNSLSSPMLNHPQSWHLLWWSKLGSSVQIVLPWSLSFSPSFIGRSSNLGSFFPAACCVGILVDIGFFLSTYRSMSRIKLFDELFLGIMPGCS